MVVVVTTTEHVADLPVDSDTVIVAVPAATDVTVNVEPDAETVAMFGLLLVAVNDPPYERSTAENVCVSPMPLNVSDDGMSLNAGVGEGVVPGATVGAGVGVGKLVGTEDGAAVGAWVGAMLGAGVGVAALLGAA